MPKIIFTIALVALVAVTAAPKPAEAAWCWWWCGNSSSQSSHRPYVSASSSTASVNKSYKSEHKRNKHKPKPVVATTTAPAIATSTKPVATSTPTPVVVAPVIVTPPPAPVVPPPPAPTPAPAPTVLAPGEESLSAWLTAYTYYDNDPPGSAAISHPIIHSKASGTGTFADPITLAVGFTKAGPDIAAGTRYYVPNMRKYFIVEDTCASCHPGYKGNLWLDMWIDGGKTTEALSTKCAESVTGVYTVIKNPKSNYAAVPGVISGPTCAPQFGNTLVVQ